MDDCRLAIDELAIVDWRSTQCRLLIGDRRSVDCRSAHSSIVNPSMVQSSIVNPSIVQSSIDNSSIANRQSSMQSAIGNRQSAMGSQFQATPFSLSRLTLPPLRTQTTFVFGG